MSDTPNAYTNVAPFVDKSVHSPRVASPACNHSIASPVDDGYPQSTSGVLSSVSPACETIETAPTEVAPSRRSLTKSAPEPAKTREVSMATTQDKPTLRPSMAADDPRHGQMRGYSQHRRSGEEPCDECRAASAQYEMRRRKRSQLYGHGYRIPALGTVRRIQALMALGHRAEEIAHAAGWDHRRNVLFLIERKYVMARTAKRIDDAYRELGMTAPTDRWAKRRRSLAASKGWVPPLAWDCIDTDEAPYLHDDDSPNYIDEVKVQRVLDGIKQDCTPAERYAVLDAWTGSLNELSRITGWNTDRMIQQRKAA